MAFTDNWISFFELDESEGSRGDGIAASSNTLTDNNTVTAAAGKVRGAAQFTLANGEYFRRTHNPSISCGNINFLICAHVFLDSKGAAGDRRSIFSKNNGATGEYDLRYLSTDDRFNFIVLGTGGAGVGSVLANSFGSPSLSTWYFVVAWLDATAATVNIQVNNGAVDTVALGGTPVTDATSDLTIGARGDLAANMFMDGRLDQIGLWKRVLDSSERSFLYNQGNGRSLSEIVAESTSRLVGAGCL